MLKITIHTIDMHDDREPLPVIVTEDSTTPGEYHHLALEKEELAELRRIIGAYLTTGDHAGMIDEGAEQLGFRWLTVSEAVELAADNGYSISRPSVRRACARGKIRKAARQGRDWRFPQSTFLWWLANPASHKTGKPSPA